MTVSIILTTEGYNYEDVTLTRRQGACFLRTCDQIIEGRNLQYGRTLQIVQNEEYLTQADIANAPIIRRKKGQLVKRQVTDNDRPFDLLYAPEIGIKSTNITNVTWNFNWCWLAIGGLLGYFVAPNPRVTGDGQVPPGYPPPGTFGGGEQPQG